MKVDRDGLAPELAPLADEIDALLARDDLELEYVAIVVALAEVFEAMRYEKISMARNKLMNVIYELVRHTRLQFRIDLSRAGNVPPAR